MKNECIIEGKINICIAKRTILSMKEIFERRKGLRIKFILLMIDFIRFEGELLI